MNILFLYDSEIIPNKGGVQRVTDVLTRYFKESNFNVFQLAVRRADDSFILDENQFILPNQKIINSGENIAFLKKIVFNNKIDIIINQGAIGKKISKFCVTIKKFSDVKIIAVFHNSLLGNVINYTSSHFSQINRLRIPFLFDLLETSIIKKLLLILYRFKYRKHYYFILKNYDKVVLLSNEYQSELRYFLSNFDQSKICSIPNPCTLKLDGDCQKINELLYVGRIDMGQKKVDYLIKIWGLIYNNFPNWELSILGDGIDKSYLESNVKCLGLERVNFYGSCDPIPFYKRAKILCMTSSYEGFPLVLLEAQVFGTVPIAFSSFSSINDIIEHYKNGILVKPFQINNYKEELSKLMLNEEFRQGLSENGKINVIKYSLENISDMWILLFKELLNPIKNI
jgi:glycosyltransferase involved in cell wall biosynthesis